MNQHHYSITRRAFTLVEFLVVMSIIALLIALILPALKNARDTAHIAMCASRQHQLLIGLFAWAADHDGALPPGSGYSSQTTVPQRGLRGSGDFFDELLANGVTDPQVW